MVAREVVGMRADGSAVANWQGGRAEVNNLVTKTAAADGVRNSSSPAHLHALSVVEKDDDPAGNEEPNTNRSDKGVHD